MSARRWLLALAVAGAPLLQLAGMVPHPVMPEAPAEALAVVADDPGEWFRIHVIAASSAALSIVAAVALAGLVRRRGAALATTGAVLAVLGGAALATAFGMEAQLWSLAADPSLDRTAIVELVSLEHDSPGLALLMAGFPLAGVGGLLVMLGLLRSGVVPRWQPALVVAGLLASVAAAPGSSTGPFLFAPAVLGYLALATSMLRSKERERERETAPSERTAVLSTV
jgi:hypothetical protein